MTANTLMSFDNFMMTLLIWKGLQSGMYSEEQEAQRAALWRAGPGVKASFDPLGAISQEVQYPLADGV